MEPSVNTNAKDIARLQTETKTLFKNLGKHEEKHEELVTLMHSIDTAVAIAGEDRRATRQSFEDIKDDIKKLKEDMEEEIKKLVAEIETLKDRPRNRVEAIITAVIIGVAGVIVGLVLSKIGLTP